MPSLLSATLVVAALVGPQFATGVAAGNGQTQLIDDQRMLTAVDDRGQSNDGSAISDGGRSNFIHQGGFLSVGSSGGPAGLPQIVDSHGRAVLLRGVNVNGLEDYYANNANPVTPVYPIAPSAYAGGRCPQRNTAVESIPVCRADFAQLSTFGYDAIRLGISWSLLEPSPGKISSVYVDRIAQVVRWASQAGIYVIIDMHQDAWSKYLYTQPGQTCPSPSSSWNGYHEADGAPAWATLTTLPVCYVGAREVDPAVQDAFQHFYDNAPASDGVGVQTHFDNAFAALAKAFASNPTVAGYDLFNEPSPGLNPPMTMDSSVLMPLYARVVSAMRAAAPAFKQLVFLEPDVTRDTTDATVYAAPWSAYSSYKNAVFAPHIYTRVFTPDGLAHTAAGTPTFQPMSEGYTTGIANAHQLGTPLWIGEFGALVSTDATILAAHYREQDRWGLGGTLWVWKAPTSAQDSVLHGPFGPGIAYPSRVLYTQRAYPMTLAGNLTGLAYSPTGHTFRLTASSGPVRGGDLNAASLVWLPPTLTGPAVVTGARSAVITMNGGREVELFPTGGAYSLSVTTT